MKAAATLDQFNSPSMRETPGENYVFGDWFLPKRDQPAPTPAAHALELPVEDAGDPLWLKLSLTLAAGGLATGVLYLLIHAVLGR